MEKLEFKIYQDEDDNWGLTDGDKNIICGYALDGLDDFLRSIDKRILKQGDIITITLK